MSDITPDSGHAFGLPGETPSKPAPLDIWAFDSLAVDLTQAGLLLDVAGNILRDLSRARPDGSRFEELDQIAAVLAAGKTHVEKMIADFEGQVVAWRSMVKGATQ